MLRQVRDRKSYEQHKSPGSRGRGTMTCEENNCNWMFNAFRSETCSLRWNLWNESLNCYPSMNLIVVSSWISETTCRNACTTTTIQVQDSYSPSCWKKVAGDFLKSAGKPAETFLQESFSAGNYRWMQKNPSGFRKSLPSQPGRIMNVLFPLQF